MRNNYDAFEVRVPVGADQPTYARNAIVRDRPETYMAPRGLDRLIYIAIGSGHSRLYLVPEEAEALAEALEQWKARRAALRCAETAESER